MRIQRIIEAHLVKTGEALFNVKPAHVRSAAKLLEKAKDQNRTVFLFGNGGSHATASHMQNDLIKVLGISAVCISDMTPTCTAYANDDGYGQSFVGPLKAMMRPGDVIFGISCSGNSENVVNAFIEARHKGNRIILLTGAYNGRAEQYADVSIHAGNYHIRIQESVHSAVCHALIDALEEKEL